MELEKNIILFDGVCELCNKSVLFIIRRDKKDRFRFAALQSEMGQKMIQERHIDTAKVDSILLIEPGVAYYTKSTAALKIGQTFGGFWKILHLLNLIPRQLRDIVYDLVARNRYAWFGKKEQCMVPTPEIRSKFLEFGST